MLVVKPSGARSWVLRYQIARPPPRHGPRPLPRDHPRPGPREGAGGPAAGQGRAATRWPSAGARSGADLQGRGRGADREQAAGLAQRQARGAVGLDPRDLRLSRSSATWTCKAVDTARRARRAAADLDGEARDGEPGAPAHRGGARLRRGARALRSGDNPARWRGHLDHLLPKPAQGARGRAPCRARLARGAGLHGRAGAARGHRRQGAGVRDPDRRPLGRGARHDLGARSTTRAAVWTVPAGRIKAGKEHRVPLTPAALALLGRARASPTRWCSRAPTRPEHAAVRHDADGGAAGAWAAAT